MKYISKGYVVEGSTEHIMHVSHFGREFQLTGVKAGSTVTDASMP